jgi:anti-sigma-K factor RskA
VRDWEERLLPLTRLVEPVTPPAALWERIEHSLEHGYEMEFERGLRDSAAAAVAAAAGAAGAGGPTGATEDRSAGAAAGGMQGGVAGGFGAKAAGPFVGARASDGAIAGPPGVTAWGPDRTSPGRRAARWFDSLRLWRGLAAGGFAAAGLMAVALALQTQPQQDAGPRYLVVLSTPQGLAPGWIAQADDKGELRLRPVAPGSVPAAKSLQLWTKADAWRGPVSLGLVTAGKPLDVSLKSLPPLEANQLFEITLEPDQGSPIDRPTGPILYIGRTVKMDYM